MTDTELQVLWIAGFISHGVEPGGFRKALITAAFKADSINTEKLRLGFPEIIDALDAYRAGKLMPKEDDSSNAQKLRLGEEDD